MRKVIKGDPLQRVLRYFEKFFQHLESDGGKADTTSTQIMEWEGLETAYNSIRSHRQSRNLYIEDKGR